MAKGFFVVVAALALFSIPCNPANATTIPFTILGNLGLDTITGSGDGIIGTHVLSSYSFTVSGSDPTWTSYVGSYQPVDVVFDNTSNVWSFNPSPSPSWTPNTACFLPGGCTALYPNIILDAGGLPDFILGSSISYKVAVGTALFGVDGSNYGSGAYAAGSSVVFDVSAPSPVPLPPALPMFTTALLALGAFAWWRRRQEIV